MVSQALTTCNLLLLFQNVFTFARNPLKVQKYIFLWWMERNLKSDPPKSRGRHPFLVVGHLVQIMCYTLLSQNFLESHLCLTWSVQSPCVLPKTAKSLGHSRVGIDKGPPKHLSDCSTFHALSLNLCLFGFYHANKMNQNFTLQRQVGRCIVKGRYTSTNCDHHFSCDPTSRASVLSEV